MEQYRCQQCGQLFFQPIVTPDEHGTYTRIAGNNYFVKCGGEVKRE